MNHEDLIKALGKQAREDGLGQRLDRRWDQLSAGTLSPEEEARLRAEAETSPAGEAAWEAFRPLDTAYRTDIESRLAEQIKGAPRRRRPPARPTPAERPGSRWWMGSLAVAATVLLVVLVRLWLPSPRAPVPHYTLSPLAGKVQELRSNNRRPTDVPVYEPGTRLRLVLKPETTVRQPIAASAYVVEGPDGARFLEALTITTSSAGAVLMEGTVGEDINLPNGRHTLLIVVGRPGNLPTAEELRAELADRTELATVDWHAWRRTLIVRPSVALDGYEQP